MSPGLRGPTISPVNFVTGWNAKWKLPKVPARKITRHFPTAGSERDYPLYVEEVGRSCEQHRRRRFFRGVIVLLGLGGKQCVARHHGRRPGGCSVILRKECGVDEEVVVGRDMTVIVEVAIDPA